MNTGLKKRRKMKHMAGKIEEGDKGMEREGKKGIVYL